MLQMAIIAVVTVIVALQFRNLKQEYELIICICGGLLIMGFVINKLVGILHNIRQMQAYVGLDEAYFQILIKIIGITYLSEFASDMCKDTGHAAIGNYVELAGKLSIMAISMPVIMALLDTIRLL